MCRGVDHGGRRCPSDNGETRRARQRASYAAKKARTTAAGPPAVGRGAVTLLEAPPAAPTKEQVTAAVARARDLLGQVGPQPHPSGEPGVTISGERMLGADEQGWDQATAHGAATEQAVRDAGALLAARAEHLAEERLAEIDHRWAIETGSATPQEHAELCTQQAARARLIAEEYLRQSREARAEGDEETARQLWQQAHAESARHQEIAREAHACTHGTDPWSIERSKVMADAYRQVLAEQRTLGLPEEGLILDPTSQKPAVRRLEQALTYYPTDWIEDSNQPQRWESDFGRGTRMLRVRTTRGRAHYSHQTHVERREKVTRPQERLVPVDQPLPEGAEDTGATALAVEYMPGHFMEIEKPDRHPDAVIKTVRKVQVPVTSVEYTSRPVAELLVDTAPEGCQERGVSTAIHEFGHRTERLRPRIADLERVFLARRTTGEDGKRDRLVQYHGKRLGPATADRWTGKEEWVRGDDLVDQYVGKTYGPEVNAREVFSVGMEGLFAGRFAGFKGNRLHKKDLEHRDLTLGILATC